LITAKKDAHRYEARRIIFALLDIFWGWVKRRIKCKNVGGMKSSPFRKIFPHSSAISGEGALRIPATSTFQRETHRRKTAKDRLTGLAFF
jgi:hypothetical protein